MSIEFGPVKTVWIRILMGWRRAWRCWITTRRSAVEMTIEREFENTPTFEIPGGRLEAGPTASGTFTALRMTAKVKNQD
jgi:hypothetical protein